MEFEFTGKLVVTTGGAQNLEWKHKLCDYKFCYQINKGNNTWHTGTWNNKIHNIVNCNAKAAAGNIKVQARARYIIDKRESNTRSIVSPVKSVSFLPLGSILSTISMR